MQRPKAGNQFKGIYLPKKKKKKQGRSEVNSNMSRWSCELSRDTLKVLHTCREIHEHETKPSTD